MQKYLDQIEKYLQAQQVQKTFLADNQKDLFYFKTEGAGIFLYHLDLSTQGEVVDLTLARKVLADDFSKDSVEFEKYFADLKFLYISLDQKNNEFSNLYRLDLNPAIPQLEKLTNVRDAKWPRWTQDHQIIYFINRYPIENGLFRNEFYKLNTATGVQTLLFDDQEWIYKVGWGGFKLSEDEKFLILSVDKNNKREHTNLIKYEIAEINSWTLPAHPPEPKRLLLDTMEDGGNYFIRSISNDGFYFRSDSNKFNNVYYFDLKTETITALTEKKWVNISMGYFKFGQDEFLVVTEPLKSENRTQIWMWNLTTRQMIEKKLSGNYSVSQGQGYFLKTAIDQVPTFYVFNEKLELTQSYAKFVGDNLIHGTYEIMNYPSFDGLEISAYFVKPKVPLKAVAVISFYGGENYYHFYEQLFLENGIGIFSPAVRGSWGWGRDWEDHLKHDLGGKEILDVIWAAKYISQHASLPENRIGLWGASHGGYATLRALTLPNDFGGVDSKFDFGFGICECGFADLEDFHKTSRIADWLVDLLGAYPEKTELYRERSPSNYFENLKAPLFLRHGTTDSRVPLSTVQGFIDKLQNSKIKHDVMIQKDQGHHTNDPGKLKIERARIMKFLDEVLTADKN